jgi:hypothetical protein
MGIEILFIDEASELEIARTILDPEQLPETFAISTTLTLGDGDWTVVAADPVTRSEIERAGRVRLTLRRKHPATTIDPRAIQFSMPTICDPLPAPDPTVSLADIRAFVINEDLWRDVEWIPRRHAANVEANFAAINAIRAAASGPFPKLHLRTSPLSPLLGSGLTVQDVATALGPGSEQLDGVVIDTLGAGFIADGFAFLLPGDAHVYGYCENGEGAVLGLQREGARESLPGELAALTRLMRSSDADLIVWPYCQRIEGLGDLESWYLSGRACTKTPW